MKNAAPPYSYAPGEISPTNIWFPALLDKAELTVVGVHHTGIIGYNVALPFNDHGNLGDHTDRLGIDPDTTIYIAELGAAESAHRQGIANQLLNDVHTAPRPQTTTRVVRTPANNTAATAPYRRHGNTLLPNLTQHRNGRERVFPARHP